MYLFWSVSSDLAPADQLFDKAGTFFTFLSCPTTKMGSAGKPFIRDSSEYSF
jgi:hypothetical protein